MDWIWYAYMLVGPALIAGGAMSKTVRRGLKTRHQRKMALMTARHEERLALETADRPPAPVCGCEHHLAKHDKQGKCHETVEKAVAWDAEKKPVRYESAQCNCQQYVGPQPLAQVYAEELTDLS